MPSLLASIRANSAPSNKRKALHDAIKNDDPESDFLKRRKIDLQASARTVKSAKPAGPTTMKPKLTFMRLPPELRIMIYKEVTRGEGDSRARLMVNEYKSLALWREHLRKSTNVNRLLDALGNRGIAGLQQVEQSLRVISQAVARSCDVAILPKAPEELYSFRSLLLTNHQVHQEVMAEMLSQRGITLFAVPISAGSGDKQTMYQAYTKAQRLAITRATDLHVVMVQ